MSGNATGGPQIKVLRLPHGDGLPLPFYATAEAAGADLHAALEKSLTLEPGRRASVPTGLCLEIPAGFEVQVRPRSGLAARHGVTVLNTPGTIDSDYRGEVKVILVNLGDDPLTISRGDRIAQMVVAPVVRAAFDQCDTLAGSERGTGGFGSTGQR